MESHLVDLFADTRLCTDIGKRKTLMVRDLESASKLRGDRPNDYKIQNRGG